jgi:hypothetical protein
MTHSKLYACSITITDDAGNSESLTLHNGDWSLTGVVPDGRAPEVYERPVGRTALSPLALAVLRGDELFRLQEADTDDLGDEDGYEVIVAMDPDDHLAGVHWSEMYGYYRFPDTDDQRIVYLSVEEALASPTT